MMIRFVYVITTMIFLILPATADEDPGTLDLDSQRETAIKAFDATKIPDPNQVEKLAESIFAKPVDQQTEKELKLLASQANKVANLIGAIESEYDSYYRENYRYDFITEKVMGPYDKYAVLGNKFKDFRNRAYFNLGKKLKTKGETLRAFLYFKDAFRLAIFNCESTQPESCMRWKAEQEMKALLSITGLQSYIRWQ